MPMTQTTTDVDWSDELTHGFAARLIRWKAGQLVGHFGFRSPDIPDIEQHLKLRLLERRQRFDATQTPWQAFVRTVVRQGVRALIRHRRTQKRILFSRPPANQDGLTEDQRGTQKQMPLLPTRSLSEEVVDSDGAPTTLHQLINEADRGRRLCQTFVDPRQHWEMREDVQEILSNLPEDERRLCELLMQFSVAEVARQLGIPRSTLRNQIEALKSHFVAYEGGGSLPCFS